ncbi:hypothetical protein Hanom_Chr13g01239561 [Helianthus anomalus]
MAHLMHIFVLMISLYFRYRFTLTRLNFLSYSLLVPVMFLGFQGFLNHNKSSMMLPRSMVFSIFNSIQPCFICEMNATEHPGAIVDEDVQSVVITGLVGRN